MYYIESNWNTTVKDELR